jgi:peroxiredoxin
MRFALLPTLLFPLALGSAARAQVDAGELVPALQLRDLDGRALELRELARERGVVVVLRDEACPLCRRWVPRLQELAQRWRESGPRFLFANSGDAADAAALCADRERLHIEAPYVADTGGVLARSLGASSTTEVFLIDARGTLVYRGAIDDQHAVGSSKDAPTRRWLEDAVAAMARSERPAVERTSSPGCALELGEGASVASEATPTYHGTIARLVERRCLACHREGGVAPFPLATHAQVVRRKATIANVVESGVMPPWGAAEGSGPWRNDFGLRASERAALLAWIAGGAPEGDAALAPLRARGADFGAGSGWSLGEPDLVVELPRAEKVKAQGTMDYRYQWVQSPLEEERWVRAVELRPTAPAVVHHVLTFLEEPPKDLRELGQKRRGGLSGYFAGLVPGQGPTVFPTETGKRLPARAWIKFQLHYTANGEATSDRTQMAFWFHATPPQHELVTASAHQTRFEIPPGAASHEVRAKTSFRESAWLSAFSPHMHVRGKAFRYELELPDGARRTLLDIPRYDFDWQIRYELAEPLFVPAGAVLHATAWYDNSAANPANPDPTRAVRFGEQTWDEMMIGYFERWR